ncbi:MAG: cobalt-precorrin-5B (C(1))-methyltransferase, partial [Pseudomonadota bacterium]
GLLKYLKRHPIPRLTIAGGFGKLTKLAQGALDLHSSRSQVDFARLAELGHDPAIAEANTAMQALEMGGAPLAAAIAERARATALAAVDQTDAIAIDVLVVSRDGRAVAAADTHGGRAL